MYLLYKIKWDHGKARERFVKRTQRREAPTPIA